MAVRVALAEDSFLVREALTGLLEDSPEVELVAVCENAEDLRDAVEAREVDVVVTDIRMPPGEDDAGVRLARELRRTHPDVGVILLSAYCDVPYALALLEGGSDRRGYLLKDRVHSGRELIGTIETVASGGSVIDAKVVETLATAPRHNNGPALASLTPREREILVEMASGASNAAIGDRLGMAKRAVEKHINSIFAKLAMPPTADVSRRVRAVLIYLSETESIGPIADQPRTGTPVRP
jgi:DNA-binding NarL/FixJ family response regulator